jgi:tetratricopeptide (TPR) repeat protein
MKTRILASLIAGFLCWNASAQTADDWVSQGRSYLAAHDITDANASFAQALALDPNHKNANALYAITRLLVLPSQPAGSNFLTRIGFPIAGRNIYNWVSVPPKDTNGLWLAPNGVNANEFTAQLRTNALPVVSSAIGNLAAITDTNFTISLTSSETAITDVTVDYGDLKLIQAGLYALEYSIYMLHAQNLDAQLTALRALYTNGVLSVGHVLSDYPQLFTFATTNDLQAASAAFINAVNNYMTASRYIRSRPPGAVRLFNYDEKSAKSEAGFRLTLQDLKNSLEYEPQFLALDPDLMVDMTVHFSGDTSWRSLLPKFDGNAIELGSLPDETFGGLIYGLTREDVESYLSGEFIMLPVGYAPLASSGGTVLSFATLRRHYYALEASTNLVDWQVTTVFTASNAVSTLIDSQTASTRFYRLRDLTGFLAFAGVVSDQNTGLPIAGAQVLSVRDGTTTFTDANGQFLLNTTLSVSSWWTWDELKVSATGYTTTASYYYGNGLVSGLQIYLSSPPPNDNFANRIVLSGTNVIFSGNNSGATQESGEPNDVYGDYPGGKSVWFSWTAPTSGSYSVSVSSTPLYGSAILAIYSSAQLPSLSLIADVEGYPQAHYTINAVTGQTFQIEVDDDNGYGSAYTLSIAPSP